MSYKFEKVGDNKDIWEELCFRDWGLKEVFFSKNHRWCADKERDIYLKPIGSFRDETPNFYDLSYKHRIIRLEVNERGELNENSKYDLFFSIDRISVPHSVWNENSLIRKEIENAFCIYGNSLPNVAKVSVIINCEPECVEVDYNGH